MRLFEFALDDSLRIRLIAVINQLKARLSDSNSSLKMNTTAFINLMRKNGIELTLDELFDIYDKDPMSQLIDNLNNTEVTFKGSKTDEENLDSASQDMDDTMSDVENLETPKPTPNQYQLDKMSKRAAGIR